MIVSINLDEKPNGERWGRERCSNLPVNRIIAAEVRLRSDAKTASKRQQERAARQLVQHNCWRKAEGNTLNPAVFSATGRKKNVHLSGGLGAARPPSWAALHKSSASAAGCPFDPDTGVWKASSVCGPTATAYFTAHNTHARPVGTFACTVTA